MPTVDESGRRRTYDQGDGILYQPPPLRAHSPIRGSSSRAVPQPRYHNPTHDFTADPPMHTDFASVPRMFIWFLPRYGSYTKAAILHDHLWRVEVRDESITRREADGIFRQAMRQLEVPFLRRWIMWAAVRWASLAKKKDRQGWLRDAPLVVLISVLALPIVLPPGILIMVSLVLFWAIEWSVYPFLKMAERAKGAEGKKANRPHFPLKTG
jgi:Protein of unknown function (DUF1353)